MRKTERDGELKVIEDVETFGWHVMKVMEDSRGPGFAYTVGLHQSFEHPELIVLGLPADVAHTTLNIAGEAIRRGERFSITQESDLFFEGRRCIFRRVPEEQFRNYLGWDLWFYDGASFAAMQLVWADRNGRWPWEPDVDPAFSRNQPIIEDQGDPPWARGRAG